MSTASSRKHHINSRRRTAKHDDSTSVQPQCRLLTVKQAAEMLGTTEHYPRRLIKERRVAYVKFGTARCSPVRIPENELLALIAAGTVEATN